MFVIVLLADSSIFARLHETLKVESYLLRTEENIPEVLVMETTRIVAYELCLRAASEGLAGKHAADPELN